MAINLKSYIYIYIYTLLIEKPEGKNPHGSVSRRWKFETVRDLKVMGSEGVS
jgi:hypothetical protein